MKRNIIKIAPKWSLVFNTILVLIVSLSQGLGQTLSRTYTKEMTVAPHSNIVSKGPRHLAFESSGRMSSEQRNNESVIVPGGNDGIPALVVKDFEIYTWDENKVKQRVEITVIVDEDAPDEGQQLLDKLKIRLTHHADGSIPIDGNMNIAKFGFVNGFFKRNTNTVTLENGTKFRVKSLRIKSQVYMPKQANLTLMTDLIGVKMGDLAGTLDLDCRGGKFQGGNVQELHAHFLFANASFKNAGTVNIRGLNSTFQADSVQNLNIGHKVSFPDTESKRIFISMGRTSSASTYKMNYVSNLLIEETVNDKFLLGKVDSLESRISTFSNYEVEVLTEQLKIWAKNGDLTIKEISPGFKLVKIENELSTIELGLEKTENYKLEFFQNSYTEYTIPLDMSAQSNATNKYYQVGDQRMAGKISLICNSCKIRVNK